jgi:hypothetical protein
MPRTPLLALSVALVVLAGCGGGTTVLQGSEPAVGIGAQASHAVQRLGFPTVATKNTTRVGGGDPVVDAAAVALAVYPSAAPGTHPQAVTLAPTSSWQGAIAASVLMAPPIRAPILLSNSGSLPRTSADALGALAPTGSGAAGGFQLIRIGNVPNPSGVRSTSITGSNPYALAASIDRFESAARGKTSDTVVIASGDDPAYALPAAGWAAESGEPVLFVNSSGVPPETRQALLSHQRPKIYVLGPSSVIPDSVLSELRSYGPVNRVAGNDPISNAVAFASYRDPPCAFGQPCGHIPGSFGWALRSPGHGYVVVNLHQPLAAAAAAPLSGSGDYGPILLLDTPSTMPKPLLNFFLDYGTPAYSQYGPTAAVYNHAWVIGDQKAISLSVQAELDSLLEVVPQSK